MDKTPHSTDVARSGMNPWVVALITAPIPLLLFVLFVYKWYQQGVDFDRVKTQFMERQNKVLAYEAIGVSHRINDLLETAARDVQTFSLIPVSRANFLKFYLSNVAKISEYREKEDRVQPKQLPLYNELSFIDLKGRETLRVSGGRPIENSRTLASCRPQDLCDRELWETALNLPVGEMHFGNLMRYYTPSGEPEIEQGAHYPVAFRAENGVFLLGIDYRHVKDILYLPTFPYQPKTNLYQAYLDGNYIYFVDDSFQFFAHPKYWHVSGIDRRTGERVRAVQEDGELGKRPLNVAEYRGEKLRDYFKRLVNVSFTQRSVDVFEAPNLTGTIRVLSVSPILFDKGQFRKTGLFGYVLTGCNVDYFTEPKEQYLPYY